MYDLIDLLNWQEHKYTDCVFDLFALFNPELLFTENMPSYRCMNPH